MQEDNKNPQTLLYCKPGEMWVTAQKKVEESSFKGKKKIQVDRFWKWSGSDPVILWTFVFIKNVIVLENLGDCIGNCMIPAEN